MSSCSELLLSFKGDNGSLDMLGSVTASDDPSVLMLEEIRADPSGRSFTLKRNGQELACFWLSEKSKLAGDELLLKMKNLLVRRPTLAQLTGIQELRLEFLASCLPSLLETPCSTSMEVSQDSSAVINLPTRTSASAVIPHVSSCGQSPPTSGLQESSLLRSLSIASVSESSQEGVFISNRGSGFCTEGLFNPSSDSSDSVTDSGESSREYVEPCGAEVHVCSPTQPNSDRFPFNNAIDKNWNTSWSTRTSISFGSNGMADSTSNGVINFSQFESVSVGTGQSRSWNAVRPVIDQLCLPVLSSPQTLIPFPSLMSEPSNSCSVLPPLSARLPISSPSFLSPYYCPCPLGGIPALHYTFSPPCLPAVCSEGDLLPPSSFFSVETSVSFPAIPLELHELQYSFPLPVSPLATAELVVHSPIVPTIFCAPVSFPVVSLHVPTQGYLVQALPVASNFGSPSGVPDCLQDIFTHHGDFQASGRDRAFPANSVAERSWGTQPMGKGHVADPEPLSISNVICSSSTILSEARGISTNTQIREHMTLSKLDASRFSCHNRMPGMNPDTKEEPAANVLKLSFPSLHGLPVLDMAPRVLSSSSLSRIISFRTTGDSTTTSWLPNSLGLYSVSCEMGYRPATSYPGSSKINSSACFDEMLEVSQGDCQELITLNPHSITEDSVAATETMEKIDDSESRS